MQWLASFVSQSGLHVDMITFPLFLRVAQIFLLIISEICLMEFVFL